MRNRYRGHRAIGDWWECRDIATQLLQARLTDGERAEAFFALGHTQEKLGNLDDARSAYRTAIHVDCGHTKATRALERLEAAASPRRELGMGKAA